MACKLNEELSHRSCTQEENGALTTAFNMGGIGTSTRHILSGTGGLAAWLTQERMRGEELETEHRADFESFHKKRAEKPSGGWRET